MNFILLCYYICWIALSVVQGNSVNPRQASLTGYVYVCRQGDILSKSEILLKSISSLNEYKTYSDETGRYFISNITPGEYVLKAKCTGCVNYQRSLKLINGENKFFNVGLNIGSFEGSSPVEYTVYGTVSQHDETVLSEATIVIINAFDREIVSTANTDIKGKYNMNVLGGRYVIYVYKAGFEISAEKLTTGGGMLKQSQRVNFVLNKIEYRSVRRPQSSFRFVQER